MSKFVDVVKHELKEAVFPVIYFFLVLQFAIVTKILILESYSVTPGKVASAVIGAIIIAKAILIIDVTPLVRAFERSPMIVRVLWKTLIYGILVSMFRYLEELIPLWSKYGSFSEGNAKMVAEVSWPHFWAIQLWIVVSLVGYSLIAGLAEHFGHGELRRAILQKPTDD